MVIVPSRSMLGMQGKVGTESVLGLSRGCWSEVQLVWGQNDFLCTESSPFYKGEN